MLFLRLASCVEGVGQQHNHDIACGHFLSQEKGPFPGRHTLLSACRWQYNRARVRSHDVQLAQRKHNNRVRIRTQALSEETLTERKQRITYIVIALW